ncbi:MAG: GNAT family N-acetyltransferase [Pseudohongiellaceae bacterium]
MHNIQSIKWLCLPYDELTRQQLYSLLRLRAEVFIVEQDCVFQDLDNFDQPARHVLGLSDLSGRNGNSGNNSDSNNGSSSDSNNGNNSGEDLLAYARLVPPGVIYAEPSISRVVTSPAVRGRQLGEAVLLQSIAYCKAAWPNLDIRIGAQQRLEEFYLRHGFITTSDAYLEDGISHIEMLLEN